MPADCSLEPPTHQHFLLPFLCLSVIRLSWCLFFPKRGLPLPPTQGPRAALGSAVQAPVD